MPQKSLNSMMAALQQDVILAVAPLCSQFEMEIANNYVNGSLLSIELRNKHAVVEISWDPRDGFLYFIGPVRRNTPWEGPSRYEIAAFATLTKDGVIPNVRGRNGGRLPVAIRNAVKFLTKHVGACLNGDWSIRPQLDKWLSESY